MICYTGLNATNAICISVQNTSNDYSRKPLSELAYVMKSAESLM